MLVAQTKAYQRFEDVASWQGLGNDTHPKRIAFGIALLQAYALRLDAPSDELRFNASMQVRNVAVGVQFGRELQLYVWYVAQGASFWLWPHATRAKMLADALKYWTQADSTLVKYLVDRSVSGARASRLSVYCSDIILGLPAEKGIALDARSKSALAHNLLYVTKLLTTYNAILRSDAAAAGDADKVTWRAHRDRVQGTLLSWNRAVCCLMDANSLPFLEYEGLEGALVGAVTAQDCKHARAAHAAGKPALLLDVAVVVMCDVV